MGNCRICGERGHSAKYCPQVNPPGTPGVFHGKCDHCHATGHKAEFCPVKAVQSLGTNESGGLEESGGDGKKAGKSVTFSTSPSADVMGQGPEGQGLGRGQGPTLQGRHRQQKPKLGARCPSDPLAFRELRCPRARRPGASEMTQALGKPANTQFQLTPPSEGL